MIVNQNDVEQDDTQDIETPDEIVPSARQAALSITIQSWATPVVGVAMLLIGLLGGFYARPLLAPSPTPAPTAPGQTAESPQSSSANQAALMAAVVSQTRHFKGDPNAPVTIIEFSDFQ